MPIATKKQDFFKIKNVSGTEAEILVYGEIVEDATDWRNGEEVPGYYGQDTFVEEMKQLRNKSKITIRINSFGGYIHVAQAMYTQLRALSGHKTVIVDGVAASAAVLVMLAGDDIKISPGCMVMIHEPAFALFGYYDSPALEQMQTILAAQKDAIIETYISHTKLDKDTLREMMTLETWMTGREAVDNGFATELINDATPAEIVMSADRKHMLVNGRKFNVENCRNLPQFPANDSTSLPTERELERSLRDSGVPKRAATALAGQYSALCLRDSGKENNGILRDSGAAKLRNVLEGVRTLRKTVKGDNGK